MLLRRLEKGRFVRKVRWMLGVATMASLLWALPVSAGINQWTSNGLHGGAVKAIAVHPSTPNTIYAGTYQTGVFKSTDGGDNWTQVNTGLSNPYIEALAIDPITPTTIYAGTSSADSTQSLFKSTNGGDSWQRASNGLNSTFVDAIAIDPITPTTLYVGTYGGGVFKSTDGAQTWIPINTGLTSTNVTAIVIDPNTPTTIYAGTWSGGVFKSANGGSSWSQINTGLTYPNIKSLALDTKNPATLYAGTFSGVFKSTNSGADWHSASTGLPAYVTVNAIAVDLSTSSTLYAVLSGTIYKSINNGTSWTQSNYGLTGADVNTLIVAPSTLYAGTSGSAMNVMQIIDPFFTTVAPLAGTYSSALNVVLTANRPATIYYTIDGSDPQSSTSRHDYSAPISIATTTTLKFYAVDGAGAVESVQSSVYTIVDQVNLDFTYGGTAPWFSQTAVSYDDLGAYQSGATSYNQSSWMETTVNGTGAIRFWWKVSSEPCCDRLSFTIDGLYQIDIRGEVDWQLRAYSIPAGSHTLRWTYSTDGSVLAGSNAGWVDQITFEQGSNIDIIPPVTTATPSGGIFISNPSVSLSCNDGPVSGCAATYYCFGSGCSPTTPFNGTPITAIGQSVLRFYSVDASGNSEAVKTASYTITTDTTPPTTTPSHSSGAYNDPNIYLFCNDGSGTGCGTTYYCVGEGCTPTTRYSNSSVYLALPSISYYSTDLAGNVETVKTATYTIDTLAPKTIATPAGGLYTTPQSVALTCDDGSGTGCAITYYCLGAGCNPATPYNNAITIAASTDLRFFSRDAVMNDEPIQTIRYTIPTTSPVVINVPTDKATIQEAIDGASDGDTVLVAPGTYSEHVDFKGKAVTVQSSGGPDVTAIDGGQSGLVVKFVSGEGPSSILQGFTIRNGLHAGSDTPCTGGGVCVYWSSPTITNNKILSNLGCLGVGIEVVNGSPIIQGNIISTNSRRYCTGGGGGAGVSVSYGTGTQILHNEISDNDIVDGSGGGIYLYATANVTVKDNIIKNNRASTEGGGLVISSADALITQNEITANKAAKGGGVYLSSSISTAPALVNNTIADNLGSQGSDVFTYGNNINAMLVNNIIVGKAGQSAVHCGNVNNFPPPIFSNNLIYTPSGSAFAGVCADQNGINGNISADPQLNSAVFGYYGLRAGSPAIDAGDNSAPSLPATDLNGAPRIIAGALQGQVQVDIGAYEYDPSMLHASVTGVSSGFSKSSTSLTVGGESVASYRYSIDGGPFSSDQLIDTPLIVANLTEGPHTVAVLGKNALGSEQLVPYTTVLSWVVETTPPVTSITPSGGTFITSQSVTLACSDVSGSGCAGTVYCLGSGCMPDIAYSAGPIAIDHTTDLRFSSVDVAGNIEDTKTVSYVIQNHVISTDPASLSFGSSLLNLPSTNIITISNLGRDTLTIGSALSINGSDATLFSVAPGGPNPCNSLTPSIAAGGNCTIAVTFIPVTTGLKTAMLHIVSDAENRPVLDISMSGIGSTVGAVTWQQTGGPYGGYISILAIDPTNSQTVYAGTFGGGIFKTVNGGATWATVNSGLTSTSISSLVIDPTNSQTLYVGTNGGFSGTNGGGLFKTTNGGTSWSAINSGITASGISSLAIDPANSQTIYAGTNAGIYKTTNGGTIWSAIGGLTSLSVGSIVIDLSNNQTLYAGTYGFYNGTWGCVFKSTNGGTTWSPVYSSATYTSSAALAIDPANSQTVYVSLYGVGVSKTTNGGATWTVVNSGLTSTDIRSLAIDPINSQNLYAATRAGIFKTTNGGTTWSSIYSAPVATSTFGLAIDPTNSQTLYAGRYPGGVLKTTNGGSSWAAMNNGLAATSINAISVDPTSSQTVYAGTCESVFKSTNGGTTWTAINNGVTNTDISSIAINQSSSQAVYIGTWGGGVFKTTNGGTNWTALNSGLTMLEVMALALDPTDSQTLYAGTNGSGIFKTIDGGTSWNAVNSGYTATSVNSFAIDPTNSQTVYAGSWAGVFKTTNGGSSWTAVNNGITATSYVQTLVVDPANSQTVYSATVSGVFKTVNGGTSWTAINSGLTSTNVYTVAFDPANSQTIYAGTIGGGVFISVDGGTTWSAINSGLPYRDVVSLAVDPTNSQIVYAGMVGGGIFRTITNVIAGKVTQNGSGLAGVTFSGAPCTTTDSSGAYSCSVAQGWSGTITPTLAGTAFTPASRSYSGVSADQTVQEYTAVITTIAPPIVITGSASAISTAGTTLNGTINDNGANTTVTFEYGLATGYGSSVSGGSVTAGRSSTAVSAAISGLACGTTYHFRAVGTNSSGTAYGSDQDFTTVACPVNGGSITGTVSDSVTGAGIQSVYVTAYYATSGAWVNSGYTDSSGAYIITGLAAGNYKLRFYSQNNTGYLDQWYSNKADLSSATLVSVTNASTTSGINAALLKGGSITGTVTDSVSGAAVPGMYVIAVDATTGAWTNSDSTNSSGIYSISGLATGNYKLRFTGAGYVEQWSGGKADQTTADTVAVTAQSITAGINMAMVKGASITGIVTDSTTGTGIQGAYIDAYNAVTDSWGGYGYTDGSGAYSITGLTTGNYKLRFSVSSYIEQWSGGKADQTAAATIAVTAPNTTAGINMGLVKGAAITGTVTDKDTVAGIQGVYVTAYNAITGSRVGSGYTHGSGTYSITGLATGNYKLVFSGTGYVNQWFEGKANQTAATTVTATAPNTTADINLALVRGGSISGTISDRATGAGVAGTYLYVIDRSTGDSAGGAQTDSNGSYTISGLASGSYRLRVDPASSTGYIGDWYGGASNYLCAGTISVTAPDATTGIDVRLDLGGSISGRVTDAATGSGISGVSISLTNTSSQTGMISTNVTVDSTGAYTIGGLPSGDYSLSFSAPDYVRTTSPTTTTVTAPASIAGIDASLVKGGGISGRVTDSTTGAGVEGVMVEAIDTITRSWVGSGTSDANGDYAITGLPSGSYALYYDGRYAGGSYGSGWNSLQSASSTTAAKVLASPVVVTPVEPVSAPLPVIYPAPSFPAFPASLAYPLPLSHPVLVVAPAITTGIDIRIDRMGAITGRVSDIVSEVPLDWISVTAHDSINGAMVGSTITNIDGTYTISGVPSGSYHIQFRSMRSLDGGYLSRWYGSETASNVAAEFAVQAPETTSGIDARLTKGGAIAGSISVSSCPGPRQVNIRAYDAAEGKLVGETWFDTNYAGNFTIGELPTGSYKLAINPGEAGFVRQWYPNRTDSASAEPVSVTAGTTTGGIEVQLSVGGGSISGKVSGNAGSTFMHATIKLYDLYSEGLVAESWTNPDGSYQLIGLPVASYKLLFTLNQLDRWYRTAGETAEASPVVVSGDGAVTGIDLSEFLPVNGVCGKAHGRGQHAEPTTELCTTGTATTITGTGPWSWTCRGSYGGTAPICATTQTSADPIPDGIVNTAPGKTAPDITDALAVLYHAAGRAQLTSVQAANADVAPFGSDGKPLGNGVVDIADVIMILRRVVGIGNW